MQLVVVRNNDLKPPTIRKRSRSQKSMVTVVDKEERRDIQDSVVSRAPEPDNQKPLISSNSEPVSGPISTDRLDSKSFMTRPSVTPSMASHMTNQTVSRENIGVEESQDEKVGRGLRKIQSMAIRRRDKFCLSSSGSSVKIRKLIVTKDNGTPILNANLKSWDVRRYFHEFPYN
jgi:hypothetical protein